DEDALGVEHRPHCAVEEVDVLVSDCLYEILHKQKPRRVAGAATTYFCRLFSFFLAGCKRPPKSIQRRQSTASPVACQTSNEVPSTPCPVPCNVTTFGTRQTRHWARGTGHFSQSPKIRFNRSRTPSTFW